MASEKPRKEYPQRLYPAGKSPLQNRSMHHNCTFSGFGELQSAVGETVYNDVMNNSQVGVILKLASRGYVWCAKTCHNLLTNQLAVERNYEIWSLIGGRPIRFSLHEFSDITRLNCEPFEDDGELNVDHNQFWELVGIKSGEGPNWDELDKAFGICSSWDYQQKRKLALLFALHVGVYGLARNSRIPFKAAKRVLVPEAFESYPWGRVAFQQLVQSIKIAKFDGPSYTIPGFVHPLLIWAYEAVDIIGEKFGRRRDAPIPLLRWRSSRRRYNLEALMEEDKKKSVDQKARVRHLVEMPLVEIYPEWADEEPDCDKKLDNMIRDILDGCLDESFWETDDGARKKSKSKVVESADGAANKRKSKAVESDDDFIEDYRAPKSSKKQRAQAEEEQRRKKACDVEKNEISRKEEQRRKKASDVANNMESCRTEEQRRKKVFDGAKKKATLSKERSNESTETSMYIDDDTSLREEVNRQKDAKRKAKKRRNEEGSRHNELTAMLQAVLAKVNAIDDRVSTIEASRQGGPREPLADVNSNAEGGGAQPKPVEQGSPDPSWLLQDEATSQPGVTYKRAIRNPKMKGTVADKVKTVKQEPADPKKKIRVKGKNKDTQPEGKKREFVIPQLSDENDNPEMEAFNGGLDKFLEFINRDDFYGRLPRHINLAPNQVDPYIGSSAVKRIMVGVNPSPAVYNPFEKVAQAKLDALVEFVRTDLDNPLDDSLRLVQFYVQLMTPKQLWPPRNDRFGWLRDPHMVAVMDLFRQRSLASPTPYRSERIAFLDPSFTSLWCSEYKNDFLKDREKYTFRQGFINTFNGTAPEFACTNKKWGEDVDTLYIVHNIGDEHWIAVEVDKGRVKAYDSINSAFSEPKLKEECKPYTRMIPLLFKQMAPPEKRKKMSEAAYSFYRVTSFPQNHQHGDCGVYTLKFIECLALGHTTTGLSDSTVGALRVKYAAEVLDELPPEECLQLSCPLPRGTNAGDRFPLQTDSLQ